MNQQDPQSKIASPILRRVAYKTVNTFAHITGRRLFLKNAGQQSSFNQGNIIGVPFDHNEFYREIEHQISHVLFRTDVTARDFFLKKYVDKIAEVAQKAGVTLDVEGLRTTVASLVDVLENHRVSSLWGLLYPGSYMLMQKMFQEEVRDLLPEQHNDLLNYFTVLASGSPGLETGPYERFKPYFVEALNKVERRNFGATLLVAKWLVTNLVNEIIRDNRGEPAPDCPQQQNIPQQLIQKILAAGGGGGGGQQQPPDPNQQPPDPNQQQQSQHGSPPPDDAQGQSVGSMPMPNPPPPGAQPNPGQGQGGGQQGQPQQDPGGQGGGQGGSQNQQDQALWDPPPVQANAQERAKAINDLLQQTGNMPQSVSDKLDDTKPTNHTPQKVKDRSQRLAKEMMNFNVRDQDKVQSYMDRAEGDMNHTLAKARLALNTDVRQDDWLIRDAMAKVNWRDVSGEDMRLQPPPPLEPEDMAIVRRLKSLFMRVMGRRKSTLSESGSEIDVAAYVEGMSTGMATPCFVQESRGMGFETLVLVDLSGSMVGDKIMQAQRALHIIRMALHFPFVKVNVWGFTSLRDGEVDLVRFEPKSRHVNVLPHVGGVTPLHVATRVGIRYLEESDRAKSLIVLTDGWPVFSNKRGQSYGQKQMQGYIRDEVQRGRRKGINTSAILIGRAAYGGGVSFDLDDKELKEMFGPRHHWRKVAPHTLGRDLVKLVSTSFVQYLKSL